MPDDDRKRAAYLALVDRVLNAPGRTTTEQRARAYRDEGYTPPVDTLLDKVATRPAQVTDDDFAAAKAKGYTEDQLFELVVCAAVGQSARLYEASLAALAEAARPEAGQSEAAQPEAAQSETAQSAGSTDEAADSEPARDGSAADAS